MVYISSIAFDKIS